MYIEAKRSPHFLQAFFTAATVNSTAVATAAAIII